MSVLSGILSVAVSGRQRPQSQVHPSLHLAKTTLDRRLLFPPAPSEIMSFFFLLVLLGIFHSVRSSGLKLSDEPGRICSMSNEKTEPSKEALTFCTEYAESSCCSISEEKTLANDFDTYWRSAAGHCPGCLVNVKAFQCAYTCGPNQADFVDVKRNPNGTAVIKASLRMCNSFCNSFHSSCGNITVAAMEANNANAFCQGFVSQNDVACLIGRFDFCRSESLLL